MKRNEWRKPAAALFAMALFAAAGAARGAEPGETQGAEFSRLDANRDGYLSRGETAKLADFDKAFAAADDNGDGRLDPAEFTKAQAIHERQRAAQFVEDSVITAKVKALLLKDPLVSGISVSVETHRGTVLLSGFVASQQQSKRAAEVAASVSGVLTVRNALVVKA